MPSIRKRLLAATAIIMVVSPAVAQEANPKGQQGAAAGMGKSQFMTNVTAEFAQIDTNKDGKATKDEIARQRTQALARQRQANNRAAFARLDADKNGSLSQQEFAAVVANAPKVNVDPLVTKLDANKDGGVTLSEFQAGATADFARLDTNKDNVLTPAEVRAGNPNR